MATTTETSHEERPTLPCYWCRACACAACVRVRRARDGKTEEPTKRYYKNALEALQRHGSGPKGAPEGLALLAAGELARQFYDMNLTPRDLRIALSTLPSLFEQDGGAAADALLRGLGGEG